MTLPILMKVGRCKLQPSILAERVGHVQSNFAWSICHFSYELIRSTH